MAQTRNPMIRNSLQQKIIRRVTLFIMLPAFLFMLVFFIAWNRYLETSIVSGINRSTMSLAVIIRQELEAHETLLKDLHNDSRVRSLLNGSSKPNTEAVLADIYDRLKRHGSSAVISGVSVNGTNSFSTYRLPESYRTEARQAEWGIFHLMNQSPHEAVVTRQAQDFSKELETDFSMGIAITDDRGKVIGYLVADLALSRATERLTKVSRVQMVFALCDRFDRVVFSQEHRLVDAFQHLTLANLDSETSLDGIRFHVSRRPVGIHGLTVMGIGDIEHVRSSFFMGLLTISGIILISSIALIAVLFISVRRLTKPLRDILGTMEEVSRGNFSARIDIRSGDEFERINERFNQLASDMESMVSRLLAQMEHAKEAEIQQLEAQLNPHFLYNTLDAASWMLRLGESNKADSILADMAKVLRYSLDRKQTDRLVSLKDDLDMMRTYLRIHEICLDDKLTVQYDIDKTALSCRIPRLLFQPLVENAVLHGIHEAGGGTICITIKRNPPVLEITISDTGPGSRQESSSASQKARMESPEASHIGMNLVQRRLALHYGDQQTLLIDHTPGGGCTVKISIPDHPKELPC